MIDFAASRRDFLAAAGLAGAAALLPTSLARAATGVPLVLTGRYLQRAAKAGLELAG